jgi:hypothetical protein
VSDDAAFEAALGVDAAGFEAGWLSKLGVDEPVPYGPLPAPPGPLPPDWQAAPLPTINPGSSGQPAPTFRTAPSSEGDISGPITIAVLGALAVLLAIGLFVVARGLSQGRPLLTPFGPTDEDVLAGAAGDDGPAELAHEPEQEDEPEREDGDPR